MSPQTRCRGRGLLSLVPVQNIHGSFKNTRRRILFSLFFLVQLYQVAHASYGISAGMYDTCAPRQLAGQRTASWHVALSLFSWVGDGVRKIRMELGLGCGLYVQECVAKMATGSNYCCWLVHPGVVVACVCAHTHVCRGAVRKKSVDARALWTTVSLL